MIKKLLNGTAGMTLIEIMVAISIMVLVMGIVGVNVMKRFEKAKIQTTQTQIKSLEQALEQYYLDNGDYPTTDQGLEALASGDYVKKVPKDPWKRNYAYTSPGVEGNPFEITSAGPDKQEGTEDDIKSWEIEE
ncbi:MAG: type II secretion system major pseudopilin GspG [Deltaproteobacteria bacterium]|nr:type II secretion system major pseudopilin GspG [Deltaproteobacteria bacterium]MBI4223493.1 type II secretion system major pseudopilin GspG [Deltaproteobacteria bacterium]